MVMIADRVKALRDRAKLTQVDLAKRLGITRSSVNAWEMGISVPSTQYVVEMAKLFHVSTDFILGMSDSVSVSVSGLTDGDIQVVHGLVSHLREKNNGG